MKTADTHYSRRRYELRVVLALLGVLAVTTDAPASLQSPVQSRSTELSCTRLCVRDFGARGDGVTDDTAAVKRALELVVEREGILEFPAGTYVVSPLLVVPANTAKNFTLQGEGRRTSTLRAPAGEGAVLTIGSSTQISAFVAIEGLAIDGVDRTRHGVKLINVRDALLEDVYVENCSTGMLLEGVVIPRLEACECRSNVVGLNAQVAPATNDYPNLTRIRDSSFKSNSQWGVIFHDGASLVVDGCDIEDNGVWGDPGTGGIWVDVKPRNGALFDASLVVIRDSWFEINHGRPFSLNGGMLRLEGLQMISNSMPCLIADTKATKLDNVAQLACAPVVVESTNAKVTILNCDLQEPVLPPYSVILN